ncbi:MAG: MFS transporter [Synechococcaceae bacterium WB9_2_112]|nr:MFS transporter [Synechococcaceae bacterium WB9_2_112]
MRHQRSLFLLASGLSTAGSFAGLTAKGWLLLQDSGSPLLLSLHFAALALPTLVFSGPAGVLTDRLGSEAVLIRAQWGLLAASGLGAVAIPLLAPWPAALMSALLLSTLLVGVASSYELTARNKYCALLVDEPDQLAPYLASFSVVFNVGKLVGPPVGGGLVALAGVPIALALDSLSYLLPIATVLWLLQPDRSQERRSIGVLIRPYRAQPMLVVVPCLLAFARAQRPLELSGLFVGFGRQIMVRKAICRIHLSTWLRNSPSAPSSNTRRG